MSEERQAASISAHLPGDFLLPLGGPEPEPTSALVGAGLSPFRRYLAVLLATLLLRAGGATGCLVEQREPAASSS